MTESRGEEGTALSVIRADQSDHQHQYNKAGEIAWDAFATKNNLIYLFRSVFVFT